MPWFECTHCGHQFYYDDDVEGDNCEQCTGFLIGIDDEDVEETEDDNKADDV